MMNDDLRARFGEEIRRRRELLGITLEMFSERTGLTPNYIGSIELGRRDPSLSSIAKLAKGLGIPPAQLFGKVADLSLMAAEAAEFFDAAPPEVQQAILALLHFLGTRPRR